MFSAPGSSVKEDAFEYYQDLVDATLYGETTATDDHVQALKDEIQNSYDLTVSEIESLISNFPANIRHTPVADTNTIAPATATASDWQSDLTAWYKQNIVIISLVQWVLIIILLIRKSN